MVFGRPDFWQTVIVLSFPSLNANFVMIWVHRQNGDEEEKQELDCATAVVYEAKNAMNGEIRIKSDADHKHQHSKISRMCTLTEQKELWQW